MVLGALLSTFLSFSVVVMGQQQAQVPLAPNRADLVGTWVSGSQGVITGPVSLSFLESNWVYTARY
jgi:hypothetical protein